MPGPCPPGLEGMAYLGLAAWAAIPAARSTTSARYRSAWTAVPFRPAGPETPHITFMITTSVQIQYVERRSRHLSGLNRLAPAPARSDRVGVATGQAGPLVTLHGFGAPGLGQIGQYAH
jgi:hypothetical protein